MNKGFFVAKKMSARRKKNVGEPIVVPFSLPPPLPFSETSKVEEKPAIEPLLRPVSAPLASSPKELSDKNAARPKTIYFSLAIVLVVVLVVSGLLILIGIDNYNQARAALPAGTAPPSLLKNPWILAGIVTAVLGAAAVFFASSAYSSKSKSIAGGTDGGGGGGELISGSESVGTQLEKLVQFAEQLGQSAQRLGRTVRQTQTAFSPTTTTATTATGTTSAAGGATAPPLASKTAENA